MQAPSITALAGPVLSGQVFLVVMMLLVVTHNPFLLHARCLWRISCPQQMYAEGVRLVGEAARPASWSRPTPGRRGGFQATRSFQVMDHLKGTVVLPLPFCNIVMHI